MKESIPWVEKYKPKTAKDVLGQDKAVAELLAYAKGYKAKSSGKKCCIAYGGVGSGKTSAVYVVANELSLELIEMNASDFRNKDAIEALIGIAVAQRSLFFSGKLILIDEIDGLSGTEDRGGIQAIKEVIGKSPFPVICTVNDPYDDKMSAIRKISLLVEFQALDYRILVGKMKLILESEGCKYDEEALKYLARRVGSDMRAAINDLQCLTASGKKALDMQTVREYESDERNRTETMQNALMKVFKTRDISLAKSAYENVDEDIDGIALWLEENLPKEYEGDDLRNALMIMSKADVYKGRIRRWQHWRFLAYIYALYSAGIALSKKEKYKKFVQYTPTKRLLKIWIGNAKYAKRKAIAEKIAARMHCSKKSIVKETMPFLVIMCRQDKGFASKVQQEYELEDEEMEWLMK